MNDAQFLALLQKVLPKATSDTHLASAIYEEVAKEVRLLNSLASFEKFCEKSGIPDLQPETVTGLQTQLADQFAGATVEITPDEKGSTVEVEIALPDRTVTSKVKVDPAVLEPEPAPCPYVLFPLVLPSDPELVWGLGRREDLSPDDAARSLARIEQEFWETKKGQEMQKNRVEKSFAEFINNVPAATPAEGGLKRNYKDPEALRMLRLLKDHATADLAEGKA